MLFNKLFDKYYSQISLALMPTYKKRLGKIYARDISKLVDTIQQSNALVLAEWIETEVQEFQTRHRLTFKELALSNDTVRPIIRAEVETEWSSFFKQISVLIDNHDFYKAIESRFKRHFEGIIQAAEVLADHIKLIAEHQQAYEEANSLGKSKERLIKDLRFLSQESVTDIFTRYFSSILLIRDDIESYSAQTLQDLRQAKDVLSFQIEKLISEEQSLQSAHEQFFLGYRLQISQQVDPIYEQLKLFSYRAEQFRSEFIDSLTQLERSHPEDLPAAREALDQQFRGLLQELEQMRSLEQANNQSRTAIQQLGESSQFSFFQEEADEAQQMALRSIGDIIRDMEPAPLTLDRIKTVEQTFRDRIDTLLGVERQYLNLRRETLSSIRGDVQFSINSLELSPEKIDEQFLPNLSYRLTSRGVDHYDIEKTRDIIDQQVSDGVLLNIGDLGDSKRDPINYSSEITIEQLVNALTESAIALDVKHAIGVVPILVDEQDSIDSPHILFFSRRPDATRPEFTALLEVRQQGKLLYIRKLVCILPLPSQVLNPLLENYKVAYRSNYTRINQLIQDDFLAKKLRMDFQGQTAQIMTQTKQKLKIAYINNLKQESLNFITNEGIENNRFLRTVDSLVLRALDKIIHGEDEQPMLW